MVLIQILLQMSLLNFRLPIISLEGVIYRVLSFVVLLAIFGTIYGLSGKFNKSLFAFNATFIIISFINLLKILYRQEPILPSDLQFLLSPFSFLTMVNFPYIVMFFILVIVLTLVLYKLKKHYEMKLCKQNPLSMGKRLMILSVSFMVLFSYFNYNFSSRPEILADIDSKNWNQLEIYDDNTFVMGFAQNLPGPKMKTPRTYSKKEVETVMDKYAKIAAKENAKRARDDFEDISVIFILSESLSDPDRVQGVKLNHQPLKYIQDPSDKLRTGQMMSPVYGGGTANAEFEVLTGMSIQNLLPNMSSPYLNFMSDFEAFPSFVDFYKQSENKKAVAMHAYHSTMFKRKSVFQTFGFDQQYYKNSFHYQDKLGNSDYISDESAYNEALSLLRNDKENDYFIHLITMQNHSKYTDKYEAHDFQVSGAMSDSAKDAISYYAQGIQYTDEATKSFIHALRNLDRKVMVVLYGDHLPALYYEVKEYNDLYTLSMTDYFVLANFDINQSHQEVHVSPSSFVNQILDLADVKMSPYHALLKSYREAIPYSKWHLFYGKDGRSREFDALNSEEKALFEDYYLIQFDMLEGQQYAKDYFYTQKD